MSEQQSHAERHHGVLPQWAVVEIDRLRKERDLAVEDALRKQGSRDYWMHIANQRAEEIMEAEQERDKARLDADLALSILARHGFSVVE